MDMTQTMWKADSSAIQYCYVWVSLISLEIDSEVISLVL
jgi:hypothetical protein